MTQLRESYSEVVDALGRQYEQLEVAVAQFDPDLDQRALAAAWRSDDPAERNRFDLLLGCFERTYMLLMDMVALSVKLASKVGAIDDANAPPLKALCDQHVISNEDQIAIEDQRRVRNASQHIYVDLSLTALRAAVRKQLKTTPGVIAKVITWANSLDDREGPPE